MSTERATFFSHTGDNLEVGADQGGHLFDGPSIVPQVNALRESLLLLLSLLSLILSLHLQRKTAEM